MATAPRARRLAAADVQPATPAVGPASGGRPQFNLSSGAATAVVFVSIVLCFILLCTYCRCARQRAIAGARSRVMREIRERVPGVLLRPTAAAAALPVLPYSAAAAAAGAKKGPLVEDCPVCLEAFAGEDGVKVVPACGHVFHAACIDQWLAVRNSCPVCRCAVVCYYADRARVDGGDGDDDDQEVVLERVVAMIEAIREEQREEEAAAARRAAASGGGGDEGLMTS
uniref:RING-type E3 ubiquitin transferase n=1 Tax=Oryza meridionalis TaxID=40149 RepID=A0A0E0F0N2_9ORYZ